MTTLQLITSHHISIHNNLQASIAVEDTYDYYYATDDFMNGLVSEIMQQSTNIFVAMKRIEEINSLNGYKVINEIHIRKIKSHFSYNDNRKNGFSNNKREMNQREYQNGEGVKGKQNDHFIKDYQKAYMSLLSTQI